MEPSHLPLSRVKKIIKLDKDIGAINSDALYLVATATEMFIELLVNEAFEKSKRDKRKTLMYKDLASAVVDVDQFEFLSEIVPDYVPAKLAIEEQQNDASEDGVDCAAALAEA